MNNFGENNAGVHAGVMKNSPRYFDWTTQVMASHIQSNVLEIGCGIGNASPFIRSCPLVKSLTAIDSSLLAIKHAAQRYIHTDIQFSTQDLFTMPAHSYESIVCSNVLEHIEDDLSALLYVKSILKENGTVALLMPAHAYLYSAYDHEVGHFRRYTKKSMQSLVHNAGLQLDSLFYFNWIGAIGWLIVNKIYLQKKADNTTFSAAAKIFETYLLPFGKLTEHYIKPPFGLSVIALCTKK